MSQTAIITGSTSGIGKASAKLFSENGWHVVLVARNEAKLNALASELPGNSDIFVCDLSSETDVSDLCSQLQSKSFSHPLKALINNAGIIERKEANDHSLEDWTQQFQVNLFAPAMITNACFQHLKASSPSTVVNVSSSIGVRPIPQCAAYSASKAAMNSWTQTLALEWAQYGITVNALCPGIVNTPIHNFDQISNAKELEQSMDAAHPLGRMGRPQELAENIMFLCGTASQWKTGSIEIIDGGISL
tara:strand:- start:52433 stop:53173 length:741 start_codon:yes stop_codon:yes gene_type:complete